MRFGLLGTVFILITVTSLYCGELFNSSEYCLLDETGIIAERLNDQPYFDREWITNLELPLHQLAEWEFCYTNSEHIGYEWILWINETSEMVYQYTEYDSDDLPTNQKTISWKIYDGTMQETSRIRSYVYSNDYVLSESVIQFSTVPERDFYWVENIEYVYNEGILCKIDCDIGFNEQSAVLTYNYDSDGKLITYIETSNNNVYREQYQYDPAGRLTQCYIDDGASRTFRDRRYDYNSDGSTNRITVLIGKDISSDIYQPGYRYSWQTNTYAYNSSGQLIEHRWTQASEINPYSKPRLTSYEYDQNGNLILKEVYTDQDTVKESVSYQYNDANLPETEIYDFSYLDFGFRIDFEYDESNNLIGWQKWSLTNDDEELLKRFYYAYNDQGELISVFIESK